METRALGWTLGELATALGGELDGPADHRILRPAPAEANDPEAMAFAQSTEFLALAEASGIGAVLVPKAAPASSKPLIRVDRPRETFGRFLAMCARPLPLNPGIDPRAAVSPEATVAETASIGPFAVVERGATIADGARIYPFVYVGEGCRVGPGATLYPHAVLYQDVEVGERTIVHSGAVLGADGFGFIWDGKRQVKIPQVGRTTIGAHAEIGANTAVDRAMMGETRIGTDTKLDNLVQVGHNTVIGEHTVVAALCGISGSVTIGDRCTFAGQVGTNDHVTIGNDVIVGGQSGVAKDLTRPGTYWGTPTMPASDRMRLDVQLRKVPDLLDRMKELERRLAELENRS